MSETKNKPLLFATAYFPPLEYFYLLAGATKASIDLHETYPKQTWRNRCRIITGNGVADLSIPVEKPFGNHTKTSQIQISQHCMWQKNHWRSIVSAYSNAPYFIFYKDLVGDLLHSETGGSLHALNSLILQEFIREMGIKTQIEYTRNFITVDDGFIDYRFVISPKPKDRKDFTLPHFKPYYQVFYDRFGFQPQVSIIDVLFNLGPDTRDYLQQPFST